MKLSDQSTNGGISFPQSTNTPKTPIRPQKVNLILSAPFREVKMGASEFSMKESVSKTPFHVPLCLINFSVRLRVCLMVATKGMATSRAILTISFDRIEV